MRIRSALCLVIFLICILYFFLSLFRSLSIEYNVTVMLSFYGRWVVYIQVHFVFFFFLFHLKVVCTKSTHCIIDCNIIFCSSSLVQSFLKCVDDLLHSEITLETHALCVWKNSVYDDDDDKLLPFFFSLYVRSFNCLTISLFFSFACVCGNYFKKSQERIITTDSFT